MMKVVKIGAVDIEDGHGNRTPFGRVNVTDEDGKKFWYFFKPRIEWEQFYQLWRKLEKPWKLEFGDEEGSWKEFVK